MNDPVSTANQQLTTALQIVTLLLYITFSSVTSPFSEATNRVEVAYSVEAANIKNFNLFIIYIAYIYDECNT